MNREHIAFGPEKQVRACDKTCLVRRTQFGHLVRVMTSGGVWRRTTSVSISRAAVLAYESLMASKVPA